MTPFEIAERFHEESAQFDEMARFAFTHQQQASPIYRRFAADHKWTEWTVAPFLPVEAFKWNGIVDESGGEPDVTFASSGTGGKRSRHPVLDLRVYERSVVTHFEAVFGAGPFVLAAHLPTYQQSLEPSSLIYMVRLLMDRFGTSSGGFFAERDRFEEMIRHHRGDAPVLLFGTAFGLMDLVEERAMRLPSETFIVETGGMKTHRREITRSVLHRSLANGFGLSRDHIWSEYGMCELLSQCYTRGGEVFYPPPWMRFRIVDVDDPERDARQGYPGLLALFDLANVHSVSAVLTSDLAIGRDGGFELLGRADAAEIRGCNFLVNAEL